MKKYLKRLVYLCWGMVCLGLLLLTTLFLVLPSVSSLSDIRYHEPLRIFSQEGVLLGEYGDIRRFPVSASEVPDLLKQTLITVEDKRFYHHMGVDVKGLFRALKSLIQTGERRQGASTLTMQVARNFYLGREKTFVRKINELLLAIKIELFLSKEAILMLYVNKVFLGAQSYGFAAAAKTYFSKNLMQLTVSEIALLVALPKAPTTYNPFENPERAKERRDLVLSLMRDKQLISQETYAMTLHEPLPNHGDYFAKRLKPGMESVAEMARLAMVKNKGKVDAYSKGYRVMTTVNYRLQKKAQESVMRGLEQVSIDDIDAPLENYKSLYADQWHLWNKALMAHGQTLTGMQPGVIIDVGGVDRQPWIYLHQGVCVPLKNQVSSKESSIKSSDRPLTDGEKILVRRQGKTWYRAHMPSLQGSLVSIDPKTGRLLAMVGGYHFWSSHFNRALQLSRQAGSVIKPFLYSVALEKGFTMATPVDDMPVVEKIRDGEYWRPKNDDNNFRGRLLLREALVFSRNLVSVRLAKALGVDSIASWFQGFGLFSDPNDSGLSIALGVTQVSPLQLARAYAAFANQGQCPGIHWIDAITVGDDQVAMAEEEKAMIERSILPGFLAQPRHTITPQHAYIVADVLKDVAKRGTGRRSNVLKRQDIYGKTGTTNENRDAWFAGFNRKQVTVVWVGYDDRKPLQGGGARMALPIWIDYMRSALPQRPALVHQPEGLISARINPQTGQVISELESDQSRSVFEWFTEDNLANFKMTDSEVEVTEDESSKEVVF